MRRSEDVEDRMLQFRLQRQGVESETSMTQRDTEEPRERNMVHISKMALPRYLSFWKFILSWKTRSVTCTKENRPTLGRHGIHWQDRAHTCVLSLSVCLQHNQIHGWVDPLPSVPQFQPHLVIQSEHWQKGPWIRTMKTGLHARVSHNQR